MELVWRDLFADAGLEEAVLVTVVDRNGEFVRSRWLYLGESLGELPEFSVGRLALRGGGGRSQAR